MIQILYKEKNWTPSHGPSIPTPLSRVMVLYSLPIRFHIIHWRCDEHTRESVLRAMWDGLWGLVRGIEEEGSWRSWRLVWEAKRVMESSTYIRIVIWRMMCSLMREYANTWATDDNSQQLLHSGLPLLFLLLVGFSISFPSEEWNVCVPSRREHESSGGEFQSVDELVCSHVFGACHVCSLEESVESEGRGCRLCRFKLSLTE